MYESPSNPYTQGYNLPLLQDLALQMGISGTSNQGIDPTTQTALFDAIPDDDYYAPNPDSGSIFQQSNGDIVVVEVFADGTYGYYHDAIITTFTPQDVADVLAGIDVFATDPIEDPIEPEIEVLGIVIGDENDNTIVLTATQTADKIEGLDGDDTIDGTLGDVAQIDGDNGDDDLSGADLIYGGHGWDRISDADTAYGGSGLDGFNDVSVAYGGAGNDFFASSVGTVFGGAGNDSITMSTSSVVDGGLGNDWYRMDFSADNAADGYFRVTDSGSSDEFSRIILPGIDIGSLGFFRLTDTTSGPLTNDLLITIPDQPGVILEDYFVSDTSDAALRDVVVQNGTVWDFDAINLSNIPDFGRIVLGTENNLPPGANPGTLDDDLFGGFGDDHLEGFAGDDVLFGSRGNDRLEGDGGDDRLFGGQGDDVLFGGTGDNRLDGGIGDDIIHARGDQDEVWGDRGNDMIFAGAEETTIMFESLNDYEVEEELDTIHNFDVEADKIHVQGMFTNDAEQVWAYLDSGAAQIDGDDLFLDLGDGRAIKLIDVIEDDQDPDDLKNFANIFVIEG